MKNKIFLSIIMLVSLSYCSYKAPKVTHTKATHTKTTQDSSEPILLMFDQLEQNAIDFVFKLAANPEAQEKLKQIFTKIQVHIYSLAEKSPNALALRKDFDALLDSLKKSALDTIKSRKKELSSIFLELVNKLLENSKKDIDNIKKHSTTLFSEAKNELKPEFKSVMEELKKLYAKDKSYPTASKKPSDHDVYYA